MDSTLYTLPSGQPEGWSNATGAVHHLWSKLFDCISMRVTTMTIAMAAMVATVWKGHQNTETETTAHICPYQIYQTEQAIRCPILLLSASSSLIILLSRIRSAIFWSAQILFIDIR